MKSAPDIADAAVAALLAEAALYPKPGLVSPVDSGSHNDMDYGLLCASARSLHPDFCRMAVAGGEGRGFREALVPLGLAAEERMLAVTNGINTHRGAIFALGLLAAAAGSAGSARLVRDALRDRWAGELEEHRGLRPENADGARWEAAAAYPSVFDKAWPGFCDLRDRVPLQAAATQSFFVLLACMKDTNLIRRGGVSGASFAREQAEGFLKRGGVLRSGWKEDAVELHREFVRRNLSPGGAADLLAAVLFLHALERGPDSLSVWSP